MEFTNIFDAHAHYDDEKFSEDREKLLSELPSKGVVGVVNAAVDIVSAETALSYGEKYPFMYAAVGIHPENLEGLQEDYLDRLAKLCEREKAVAIGEIGLDYYWDIERETQQRVFGEQLSLVNDLNAPVVIHDRDAHGDTLAFLKKYRPKKALLHCFSGSAELMRELMRLDCYISLGGTVTFKNARHSVEVAREVPIDKLLLETDAPYLTPVPFRGTRNDSSLILYTATKIAQIREMSVQEVLDKTAENAKYFYGIK